MGAVDKVPPRVSSGISTGPPTGTEVLGLYDHLESTPTATPGVKAEGEGDLVAVFRQMGLDVAIGMLARELAELEEMLKALEEGRAQRAESPERQQRRDPKDVPDRGGVLYPRGSTLGGSTAVSAMVTKLVKKSRKAPPATVALSVATPKPTVASGGIRAVAIATPTIAPCRPRIIA